MTSPRIVPDVHGRRRRWVLIGALVLLAVPIGFQLLFAIGEVAGGDLTGLTHGVLALPLIALAVAALRRPTLAGAILLGLGVPIAIGYLLLVANRDFTIETILIVEAVLLMPVLAGALLVLAGRTMPVPPSNG